MYKKPSTTINFFDLCTFQNNCRDPANCRRIHNEKVHESLKRNPLKELDENMIDKFYIRSKQKDWFLKNRNFDFVKDKDKIIQEIIKTRIEKVLGNTVRYIGMCNHHKCSESQHNNQDKKKESKKYINIEIVLKNEEGKKCKQQVKICYYEGNKNVWLCTNVELNDSFKITKFYDKESKRGIFHDKNVFHDKVDKAFAEKGIKVKKTDNHQFKFKKEVIKKDFEHIEKDFPSEFEVKEASRNSVNYGNILFDESLNESLNESTDKSPNVSKDYSPNVCGIRSVSREDMLLSVKESNKYQTIYDNRLLKGVKSDIKQESIIQEDLSSMGSPIRRDYPINFEESNQEIHHEMYVNQVYFYEQTNIQKLLVKGYILTNIELDGKIKKLESECNRKDVEIAYLKSKIDIDSYDLSSESSYSNESDDDEADDIIPM